MDYQFSYDFLGQPVAKCELECELFGDWLSHDLADDAQHIAQLIDITEKLHTKRLNHYQYQGKEYHLEFDTEEVELMLNNNLITSPELIKDTDFQEHSSAPAATGCGLSDFVHLLKAWQQFCHPTAPKQIT
jgi:uncharacterized protein YacL (UPF0231 family)